TVLSVSSRDEVPKGDPREQAWGTFLRAGNASPWLVSALTAHSDEAELARRGVFVYRAHDERYNIAEPYGRFFVPPQPLRVQEMPADVQRALAKLVRLDVSFAAEAYVQPAELVPCSLWSSAIYLARDGRTVRAIKGREAEARDEAGCLDV